MEYRRELGELVDVVAREGASDLHFAVNNHPVVRINGVLIPLLKKPKLSDDDVRGFLKEMLSEGQMEQFLATQEIDFSYSHSDKVRFRCNGYFQKGTMRIAMRFITDVIRTLDELLLPETLKNFALKEQGFFLVVGPVGQGKSTTLASMIEIINNERAAHIVTIEDPIEYLFVEKKAMIDQREVKIDTKDFATALVAAFRQDVNVLMVGEMRNIETMSTAVTAAETGHLVLSTLHTNNAAQTIDRVIDSFPAEQQQQIRLQLAGSLLGIFSQRLIPRISGGLIPAYELLINNTAVSNLIREGRTHEINTVIETSSGEGMIDMNRCLADLVRRGEITPESAFTRSLDPAVLERLL